MRLSQYPGTGAFGAAYQFMLENDTHAPGSVDRKLARSMVRLCTETAYELCSDFTSTEIAYSRGTRPKLESILAEILPEKAYAEETVSAIAAFTHNLGERAERDLRKMQVGGTEEEIIARGSDWCTDVARVACVLLQISGIPCRIVNLFDLDQAYSGHVIVEACRTGVWGAADSSAGVVYRKSDTMPVTVWELMNNPSLLEAYSVKAAGYARAGQFRAAGIANYYCWEHDRCGYTVSGINAYYRSILEMSNRGWPGGLRWLFGEDAREGEFSP